MTAAASHSHVITIWDPPCLLPMSKVKREANRIGCKSLQQISPTQQQSVACGQCLRYISPVTVHPSQPSSSHSWPTVIPCSILPVTGHTWSNSSHLPTYLHCLRFANSWGFPHGPCFLKTSRKLKGGPRLSLLKDDKRLLILLHCLATEIPVPITNTKTLQLLFL